MQLLLDTSVLIDALRLRRRRRQWLAELVRAGILKYQLKSKPVSGALQ